MPTFEHDIFYDIHKIPMKKKVELLREAKNLSYQFYIDKLNASESFARQPANISFDDVLERIDESTHFVFIHRKGYSKREHRLEIGFSTMETIDHFLFIYVDELKKPYFLEKYNLEIM